MCELNLQLGHSFFSATIMRIVYGLGVAEENDKYISLVEKGVDIFIRITVPGRYLVEAIPVLRHVPSWFPGAKFKLDAAGWKDAVEMMRDVPFQAAKENIVRVSSTHLAITSNPFELYSRTLETSHLQSCPERWRSRRGGTAATSPSGRSCLATSPP